MRTRPGEAHEVTQDRDDHALIPAGDALSSGGSLITSGGINARSVSAPRLLLWCSDSMQAGAHGVARLGPTGMSLQLASHANCGSSMRVARQQSAHLGGAM